MRSSDEQDQATAMVRHALRLLAEQAPHDAQIVELVHLAGWSVAEAAEHLHIPEKTAERWLRRGLKRLRQIIEQLAGPGS